MHFVIKLACKIYEEKNSYLKKRMTFYQKPMPVILNIDLGKLQYQKPIPLVDIGTKGSLTFQIISLSVKSKKILENSVLILLLRTLHKL